MGPHVTGLARAMWDRVTSGAILFIYTGQNLPAECRMLHLHFAVSAQMRTTLSPGSPQDNQILSQANTFQNSSNV